MVTLPGVILAMPVGEDRDYMEWLYTQHYRLMFSTAWKVFRDKASVDDVVAESCLALIEKVPTLRGLKRNKLRAYIVSTVRNTALNYYNKQRQINGHIASNENETVEKVADNFDVEKKVLLEEELACVWNAIEQLPFKEQQILRMKYVMDMSDDAIAKELDLATNTVRKYIGRARERIRAIVYAE